MDAKKEMKNGYPISVYSCLFVVPFLPIQNALRKPGRNNNDYIEPFYVLFLIPNLLHYAYL